MDTAGSTEGIGAANVSGGSGYYVVTAVDSGGTESVQSLSVKPAAMASAGSSSLVACFIGAAGQPAAQPYLAILVLLGVAAALGVWLKAQGSRKRTECWGLRTELNQRQEARRQFPQKP